MAESCRKVEKAPKFADLVVQLEKMKVADHALPSDLPSENEDIEDEKYETPEFRSLQCETADQEAEKNNTLAIPMVANHTTVKTQESPSQLYPRLDPEVPEEVNTELTAASAPLSKNISDSPPFECSLPSPMTVDCLKNLYVNQTLDTIDSIELEFLKDISAVSPCALVANEDRDFFQILVNNFIHCWSQWQRAVDRFQMVRRDVTQLKSVVWKLSRKTSKVSGKCQDGASVSYEYAHEDSVLDESVLNQVIETQDIMLWIVFEELPEISYDLSRLRKRISDHVLTVLLNTDVYRKIVQTEPIQLLKSDVHTKLICQITDLRWIVSVLFAGLRQHFSSEFLGHAIDPSLVKELCQWILLTAGTMIRFCRAEDHLFILLHILRLPSKLLESLSVLIQPPDPTVIWHRSCTVSEFLEQPEIQLHTTMFAACLRPVRNRSQFLLASISETNEIPERSDLSSPSQSKSDSTFLFVDSGGETDSENSVHNSRSNSVAAMTFSRTKRSESLVFVGPKDLDRILKQLNFVRLINLLNAQPNDSRSLGGKESGLMALVAFANCVMNLIESCGEIYSQHLRTPKSQDHLGSWRILAKRLASIISALVSAVGSRVRLMWYQYTQTEQHSSQFNYGEFLQILSQYDAFCLRCTKCLLSGCGLPSTHRDAVRLIGWRCLANLFPFGLASSRSKVEFLYLVINSLISFGPSNAFPLAHLPDYLIGPLHQALLSIGLNDIGLSSIIRILGNLASVECRPVHVPTDNSSSNVAACPKELPQLEALLVRVITTIIFGLSVYHYPDTTEAASPTGHKSTGAIGLLPIAPDHGRRQLIKILYAHPEVSLELLFHMIMVIGKHISSRTDLSSTAKKRSYVVGPYYSDQCVGIEELLLLLANEAPFHLLRPSADDVDELIGWLVNQESNAFTHILSRTLLCRLSWESYLNVKTGEPFLGLPLQMDFALGLVRLSEQRIQHRSRFSVIQNHPVVEHILTSTKFTASSATNLLLNTLGYRRLSLEFPSQHEFQSDGRTLRKNSRTKGPVRRSSVSSQRSHSQDSVVPDHLFSTADPVISWCINMVTRLHLPGCAISLPQKPITDSVRTELTKAWQKLLQMNSDRNPVTAFLQLSIYSMLFTSSDSMTTLLQDNVRTILVSLDWKLILRTSSILLHRYISLNPATKDDDPEGLIPNISQLVEFIVAGHMNISARSSFLPLFVGCCLDACLLRPRNCSGLIKTVALNLLSQPHWFTQSDSVDLLEWMVCMDLWITIDYIPAQFGGRCNVLAWMNSEFCSLLKKQFQVAYDERISGTTASWSEQLGTATSMAWNYSALAISTLKARLTRTTPPSVFSSNLALKDNVSLRSKSMTALFWSDLLQIHIQKAHSGRPFSWWLMTLIHANDLANQATDPVTLERMNVPPNAFSGVWLRLSPILLRNADELAANIRQSPISDGSSGPLPLRVALLLERLLLEAGLLSPTSDTDKPITDALSVSFFGRLRAVFSQLCIIQSVSLLVACPPQHPVFPILLHLLLSSVFDSPGGDLTAETAQFTKFPAGLLLLHCLPWSFCNLGCTASETALLGTSSIQLDETRSLLTILIEKMRLAISIIQSKNDLTGPALSSTASLSQILGLVLEVLDGFQQSLSRSAPMETNSRLLVLRRTIQIEVLNRLASACNRNSITVDLQNCAELWNRHRQAPIASNNEAAANLAVDGLAKSHFRRPLTGPLELPYYSLDSLMANSTTSRIPTTLSAYPRSLQELLNSLFNWTKAVWDQIAQLQQLYQEDSHLIKRLYVLTSIREAKHVECRSIFPAWMHSKKCLGGAYLTAEYQTSIIDEKVQAMCLQNAAKSDELLDALVHETIVAACGQSDESSPSRGKWTQYGLQLEALVSNLIGLSAEASISGTLYPSPSKFESVESVKAVGMQCFEQLCQNLSGPLLIFPVSKKVLADCIRQLAEEFLTSFSAAHERVLDLMVALPHLSGVLAPTFVAPKPVPSMNPDGPHPLTSVFERLVDVQNRCGAEAALSVLQQIDMNIWCANQSNPDCPPLTKSPKLFKPFLAALYVCLKQTPPCCTEKTTHDVKLREMYFEFLKSVLRNRLSESLPLVMEVLIDDICVQESQPLWVIINELLLEEKREFGKCTLSVEKLLVVLNAISAQMAKLPQKANGPSGNVANEFLLLSSEYVETVLTVFQTLLTELSRKLSCCVREKHTTSACAVPPLVDNVIGILGRILIRSCILTCSDDSTIEQRGNSLVSAVLVSISEVLLGGDGDYDELPWSSHLTNSLIQWILLAQCPVPHSERNVRPELKVVPLVVRLCAPKSGNLVSDADVWSCLHLPWSSWRPNTHTLNSMITVLNWSSGPGHDLHFEQPLASFVLFCLRQVHWDSSVYEDNSWTYILTDLIALSQWYPTDSTREPESVEYLGSLSFLCVLLVQFLRESHAQIKHSLQSLLETILSTFDVSQIDERCYAYIISHLDILRFPAHAVLMPPTSLEGRLFGLLASAGGMMSSSSNVEQSPQPSEGRLYPDLDQLMPKTTCALMQKRLCYLNKMISLLHYTVLCGQIPAQELEALKTGPLALNIVQSSSDSGESHSESLISRLLTQPVGNLFRRIVNVTTSSKSVVKRENEDRDRMLTILVCLRIGNLLSELEAVATSSAWADPQTGEFEALYGLCTEVMRLIQASAQQPLASEQKICAERNAAEHRINLVSSAMIFWILGEQATETSGINPSNVSQVMVMPRSIHAGLSRPICHAILMQNTPTDLTCVSAMVRILEACIWSILTLVPNSMSSMVRFEKVENVFTQSLVQNSTESFVVSNSFVYGCLREASLLSLFCLVVARAKRFTMVSVTEDDPQILLADIFHWLTTTDWKFLTAENPAKISGLLLLVTFIAHSLGQKIAANSSVIGCCDWHPAWKHQSSADAVSQINCAAAPFAKQFISVLSEIRKVLGSSKTSSRAMDNDSEHFARFLSFVNCIGSLICSWVGADPNEAQSLFEPLSGLPLQFDPSGEPSCFERISLVPALLARLPNFTLVQAVNYVSNQFWPDLHPCIREILSSFEH